MNKVLTTSSAAFPLGLASGSKLMQITTGRYAGRKVALMQSAVGEIQLFWSDNPRENWSSAVSIVSDTADLPFTAVMNLLGDIWLIYTDLSTGFLVCRKLSFVNGAWVIGDKGNIYEGVCRYPSVTLDDDQMLWVSWTDENGGLYYVHVKASQDSGATWESGPTDTGDVLSSGASSTFSQLLSRGNLLHLIYTSGGTELSYRSRLLSGSNWNDAVLLATTTNLDQHFHAALSDTGLLGVVYDNNGLNYREYDGYNWSGVALIDADEAFSPQLTFGGSTPVVCYFNANSNDSTFRYSTRANNNWVNAAPVDKRSQSFNSVLLYSGIFSSFEDATVKSAGSYAADIYHPSTNLLAKDSGDAIYLGMEEPFRFIRFDLSTVGAGGALSYSYWNGESWIGFIPQDGAYSLDISQKDLRLWPDYSSLPLDWQRRIVAGENWFWIRILVTSSFTIGPIGSSLGAISNLSSLSLGS